MTHSVSHHKNEWSSHSLVVSNIYLSASGDDVMDDPKEMMELNPIAQIMNRPIAYLNTFFFMLIRF